VQSFWKIALPILSAALISGAAIAWHAHDVRAHELKLADDAKVSRAKAEQGDADAEATLAHMYSYGEGVPQDFPEALRWYRKAAEQGSANGQEGLAVLYYYGYGASQDYAQALLWSRKAADQGDPEAQNALGFMYEQGQRVPLDIAEALRWYRKAVDQGYAPAEYNLGRMYYYGYGVPQDRAEARRLFLMAAGHGDKHALGWVSANLSKLRIFRLVMQLCFSLYLALDFLPLSRWMPAKTFKGISQKWISATGVLGLLLAGLDWYAYTHSLIRRFGYGITTFTILRWSLYAILLALFVYVLMRTSPRIRAETADEGTLTS
jgi:hypothetical protein